MRSDYVHFTFAIINFLIMFVAGLDYFSVIPICIALTGISLMLYVLFFYYWKIRNQFFIIFNYGSTICTLIIFADFILWSLMFMFVSFVQILSIFILIYFIYLLTLIKNFGTGSVSRKKFIVRYGKQGHNPQKVDQMWQDDSIDTFKPVVQGTSIEEQNKFKDRQKNSHSTRKTTLLTLIFTSCFLLIYIYALFNGV